MTDKILITVIIPTFNNVQLLDKCLHALSCQSITRTDMAVRVVDNGSSEDIRSITDKYAFVEYLFESQAGSYAARNKALEGINSEFIAFTDSDCIPDSEWLEQAITYLQQSSADVGAIGGSVELFAENDKPNLAEIYHMVTGFDQRRYINKDGFSVTANLVVKSNVMQKVGGFNADLMSSGDKDWCLRMQQQGYSLVYLESAKVNHPARNSTKSIKTKLRRLLGGFYFNHCNGYPNRMFTLWGMLEALMPPVRNLKRLNSTNVRMNFATKCKLAGIFYYFKLYSFTYRLGLILGINHLPERF